MLQYQLIYEEDEDEEAPNPNQDYGIPVTPRTSPEVRSRNTLPSGFSNHNNSNSGNSSQGNSTSGTCYLAIPKVHIIAGSDIKLPIFNGNGLEDPKQHWFLCEVVWKV